MMSPLTCMLPESSRRSTGAPTPAQAQEPHRDEYLPGGVGGWDDGVAPFSTADELDILLDRIAASRDTDGNGYKVGVLSNAAHDGPLPVGVEITLGHPERSSVLYLGPDGDGIAVDPTLATWEGGPVWFNIYGVPSDCEADRLRVTPAQAREVVREFVRTGHRPTLHLPKTRPPC